MKLVEMLQNQEIIIQLVWDERKVEFSSTVIDKDETSIYVTPYIHNGCELELNIIPDNNVVCNIFTDDPTTEQRISWRGLSLTTVSREDKTVYCLKTHNFNATSNIDDRRLHERIEVQVTGRLLDREDGNMSVTIHDISDNGISFYVPGNFVPTSQQLNISFTDYIDEKIFNLDIVCEIARVDREEEYTLVGCRVLDGNNNYRIYEFLKLLRKKNHIMTKKVEKLENEEHEDDNSESKNEPKVA